MTDVEFRRLLDRLEGLAARLEGVVAATPSPSPGPPKATGAGTGSEVAYGMGGGDPHRAEREVVYRRALCEAVAVLEATRTAFRSRQLKELRERIEAVLDEAR